MINGEINIHFTSYMDSREIVKTVKTTLNLAGIHTYKLAYEPPHYVKVYHLTVNDICCAEQAKLVFDMVDNLKEETNENN